MSESIHHKTATLPLPKLINRSPLWRGFLLIALACFELSPAARAVSPPPDGGYPGANTAEGDSALGNLTTGFNNTAIGFEALFSNTTGGSNTATGLDALFGNTTGSENTATGGFALYSNTNGTDNTANGQGALSSNTTGGLNTANGAEALFSNTTASYNTATGVVALFNNTTGNFNTANGVQALLLNTTGTANTADGYLALESNTTGNNNTATGVSALGGESTTGNFNTGNNNTATGVEALFSNTTGGNNTANGFEALEHNTTGSSNIALGAQAGTNLTTGSNNIDIGNLGVKGESNKIRIGKVGTQNGTFIAGIHGVTVASAVGVVVDVNGHLGTVTSSARFKDAIKPMDKASEAILSLKPVTFRYKQELDPNRIPQFGLVAEEVEKVSPDLVIRDEEGKAYTVRYEAVNAMLLNEFLKEHRTVQEQKATIAQLRQDFQSRLAEQQKQIEALTAGLQKVSAQVEMSRPAPQIVANNQ
jgi:trimeric autotransporter adhesin